MRIRRYRPRDRAGVIDLFRGFMRELTPPGFEAEFQSYVAAAIAEELGRIGEYYFGRKSQGFWIAESGGVIGMVGVERHAADAAELRRMAVARAHRRRGIGRRLLAAAEAFCRDCGYRKVVLSTSELQAAAMRLYESSGYRRVGRESAAPATHKSVGAGFARYHYQKALA